MTISEPRRVLMPIDPSEVPDLAMGMANDLVGASQEIHILAVLPASEETAPWFNWGTIDGESREDYALRNLGIRLAGTRYATANLHIAFGDPAQEIARVATELDVHLVVLPCRTQKSRLNRLLNGSVAEAVVRASPCPVLVLPMDPPDPGTAAPAPSTG